MAVSVEPFHEERRPVRGHHTLTDWLYDGLQRLAGRGDGSQAKLTSVPVTHGEVAGAGAQFVAITTNL
ncbi:MAG: hypothetical protein IPN02_18570 [Candidatus Microthrix sp.]|uniref:Uncharacterized protein n=1 Tax=Candidatus Neomicrothrix subdominans TaxID=2954438 RepID=A0A936NH38_9ACTN|nr:hypothetical protein [Candidatus Microthrix subdominans]